MDINEKINLSKNICPYWSDIERIKREEDTSYQMAIHIHNEQLTADKIVSGIYGPREILDSINLTRDLFKIWGYGSDY